MPLIEKTPAITITHPDIDHDHDEFIALVNQLDEIDDAGFPALFHQLMQHTEKHFERENTLMADYAFPALTEHRGEHQRVLGEFKQFIKRVDKGLVGFGRAYIKDRLPQWFNLHVTTMDSALAAHIQKKIKD